MKNNVLKFGILAYPARHSKSPDIFNYIFKHSGILAEYQIFEEKKLTNILKDETISGFSVSLPYKEKIIPHLDFISEEAKETGAVNTVKRIHGKLYGYNTDISGAEKAIGTKIKSLSNKHVLLLGAGGGARAVAKGLQKSGAKIYIANRSVQRAGKLKNDLKNHSKCSVTILKFEDLKTINHKFDLLINTTSIWLYDKRSSSNTELKETEKFIQTILSTDFISKFNCVMDIAYTVSPKIDLLIKKLHFPLSQNELFFTPLLSKAKQLKIPYITGEKMLLFQALKQFEIWFGYPCKIAQKTLIKQISL